MSKRLLKEEDKIKMSKTVMLSDVPNFGIKDKIGYALGDFGCNLTFVMVRTYYMVFYVTVMGLSPVHFGTIVLITRVWDAVTDVMVGSLADRFTPKKGTGKFKPWMFYGSIGLVLPTILMFTPFQSLSYNGLIVMSLCSYFLWTLSYTLVNIPYGSMASVMTVDSVERAELSKYRALGSLLGNVPAGVILPLILYDMVSGDPILSRFVPVAIVMSILGTICIQASVKMCTERIVHVEVPTENGEKKQSFIKTFFMAISNRSMIGLIIATCAVLMFLQTNNLTNQYVFMLHYQRPDLLSVTMMINYIPQILMMFFLTPLVKKIGRQNLCTYPFLGIIVIAIFMIVTPMNNPMYWMICQFLVGLLQGAFLMLMWALISDVIDYMDVKTGRREEGSVYSAVMFFRKLTSGFGTAIIGFGLSLAKYNETLTVAEQLDGVGVNVKNMAAILFLVGAAIIFLSMKFIYNLDDKKMAEIEKQILKNQEKSIPDETIKSSSYVPNTSEANKV